MNQQLLQSIESVLNLETYEPGPVVNASFSDLVSSIVLADSAAAIPSARQQKLRSICSVAEGKLEEYWARKIITSQDPRAALEQFPYIENYRELVRRELECLRASGQSAASIASALVIGSGPLPLSAMQLSGHGICVDHNDVSVSALTLCEGLLDALEIEGDHLLGAAESILLDKRYDLIMIAALAGETQAEKQAIVDNVLPYLNTNGRILVRSAAGARSLLYPELDARGFRGVTLLHEYHPGDNVINSVLIYKKESDE